jgi:thiol-disulfide isomerase/thioredoxin
MKRLFILIASLLLGAGLHAQQTNLTEAVDFTVTDCHGQTYNLFEILDSGQAVFIDFFFYTCNQCQVISPYITGSYTQMGCNMHDVFYIEISYIDNDARCQQWAEEYGVEFPTVGKDGGGDEVFDLYGIIGCPTLVLIMPDRSIAIQGLTQLYPFSAQDVVNAMQQHGLQPHDCSVGIVENGTALTLFPNPANESVTLVGENLEEVTLYNILGQKIDTFHAEGSQLVISTAKYHDGIYFVKTNNGETQRLVIAHE